MANEMNEPAAAAKTLSQVLGEITWLLSQSPIHKNLFIGDLEWFVMPAILLERFRLFHGPDGQPAGLILWATVTPEAEARLMQGQPRLAPGEWASGDRPWLIEMVAPFGGQDEMLKDAAQSIFRGQSFKYQRPDHAGGFRTVEHASSDRSPGQQS